MEGVPGILRRGSAGTQKMLFLELHSGRDCFCFFLTRGIRLVCFSLCSFAQGLGPPEKQSGSCLGRKVAGPF